MKKNRIKRDSITHYIQAKATKIEKGKKNTKNKTETMTFIRCSLSAVAEALYVIPIMHCECRETAGNEIKHSDINSSSYSQRSCPCSGPVRFELSVLIYTSC